MYSKKNKFEVFLEDVFWISYILFIVLTPVVCFSLFMTAIITEFVLPLF